MKIKMLQLLLTDHSKSREKTMRISDNYDYENGDNFEGKSEEGSGFRSCVAWTAHRTLYFIELK